MVTELAVRRVRVHGRGLGAAARTDAELLLRSLAPVAADHTVLIVRRLVLTGANPADARSRLAAVRRDAARPAGGWVDPAAGAVLFADEAEVLACLTADLVAGVAHQRWYWRSRLPAASPALTTLAAVWLAAARWLPTALALLERRTPGLGQRAVAMLMEAECAAVLAALLRSPAGRPGPPTVLTARSADDATAPVAAPVAAASLVVLSEERGRRWARHRPAPLVVLPAAGRALVAVAAVLAREPAAEPALLLAWARRVAEPRPVAHRTRPSGPRRASPAAAGDLARPGGLPADPRPREPRGGRARPVSTGPGESPPLATARPADSIPPAPPARRAIPLASPRSSNPAPVARRHPLPRRWPAGIETGHASVFFLLNLVLRAEGECVGWADLVRFGRRVLRAQPRPRRRARDPVWSVIADLAGEPVGRRLRSAPIWWSAALAFLRERDLDAAVFAQPGRLLVTRTHVDVVLGLEQIDLRVRVSGLDQDPGWIPTLGRIVAFHFEDQP